MAQELKFQHHHDGSPRLKSQTKISYLQTKFNAPGGRRAFKITRPRKKKTHESLHMCTFRRGRSGDRHVLPGTVWTYEFQSGTSTREVSGKTAGKIFLATLLPSGFTGNSEKYNFCRKTKVFKNIKNFVLLVLTSEKNQLN